MNQIFGYQISPMKYHLNDILFEGAKPLVIPADLNDGHGQVKIFLQPRTSLQSCFSQKYGAYCYVWGIPTHPEIASSDIPEYCIKIVLKKTKRTIKGFLPT